MPKNSISPGADWLSGPIGLMTGRVVPNRQNVGLRPRVADTTLAFHRATVQAHETNDSPPCLRHLNLMLTGRRRPQARISTNGGAAFVPRLTVRRRSAPPKLSCCKPLSVSLSLAAFAALASPPPIGVQRLMVGKLTPLCTGGADSLTAR